MKLVARFVRSSLGKKYLMALTGIGLVLFVIAHMIGNLQIFLGPEAINRYGHFLRSTPEILWPARIGLLALVLIHIATGVALAIENRQAREQAYAVRKDLDSRFASRTMLLSGAVIFSFIAFHLAHYTLMTVHPEFRNLHDAAGHHDVYRMMVFGFSNGCVSTFYVLSIALLSFHLSHGVGAMFQSLGLNNAAYECAIDCGAKIVAIALFIGYASIPISVLTGLVK